MYCVGCNRCSAGRSRQLAPVRETRLNMLSGSFSPSSWVEWKRRLTRLGWILILLGVIGEGLFEGATSWTDSKLQDWSNTLLLNAEALTGNAATSAKTAHDEANGATTASRFAGSAADQAIVSAKKAEAKINGVSQQADDTGEKLQLALSMLSGRSVRDPQKMKTELQQSAWPTLTFKSYKGDIEGWNACLDLCLTVGSIRAIKVNLACGTEPLVPSDALDGVQMSGFGQGWDDVMKLARLRVILKDDGGFGDLGDLGATFLTSETKKIDILIGVHPRLSLGRLEAVQKAQKNKTTDTSSPRNR